MMNHELQEKLELARAARRQGKFLDSRAQYHEVALTGRRSGDKEALVAGLMGLGQIARDLGTSSESLEYYTEAVEIARDLDDKPLLASTIRHLADVYQEIGELGAAEPLYLEALAAYRDNPQSTALEIANAVRPLALLREKQSKKREAKELWEEAKCLYESAAVGAGVAECRDAIDRCS